MPTGKMHFPSAHHRKQYSHSHSISHQFPPAFSYPFLLIFSLISGSTASFNQQKKTAADEGGRRQQLNNRVSFFIIIRSHPDFPTIIQSPLPREAIMQVIICSPRTLSLDGWPN
jgi:hypothetical protein